MDGYKIFSILVGLVYMAVLGVTESFRETGRDLFLDLLIALVFGELGFSVKNFSKWKMMREQGCGRSYSLSHLAFL